MLSFQTDRTTSDRTKFQSLCKSAVKALFKAEDCKGLELVMNNDFL